MSRAISIATSVERLVAVTPSPSWRIRCATRIRRSTSLLVKTGRLPLGRQLQRRQAQQDTCDARLQLVEALLVAFEFAGEVLEQVVGVALGVLDGLQNDDPPVQRDGQGGDFEMRAERAAVIVDARSMVSGSGCASSVAIGSSARTASTPRSSARRSDVIGSSPVSTGTWTSPVASVHTGTIALRSSVIVSLVLPGCPEPRCRRHRICTQPCSPSRCRGSRLPCQPSTSRSRARVIIT